MENKNTIKQGELYKQIQEKETDFNLDELSANNILAIEATVVKAILDEAKKNFPPDWHTWIRTQPEFIENKHIDLHDMWQRYAYEMRDWEIKWFGAP